MSQHSLTETHAQLPSPQDPDVPASGRMPSDDEDVGGSFSIQRIGHALVRYRWLVLLSAVVAAGASYVTWRLVDPEYMAEGNLWVERDNETGLTSPIAEGGLLAANAWLELLGSYSVLDPVVRKEKLYLEAPPNWRWLFGSFELAERFRPGEYRITVSPDGGRWTLSTGQGVQVASGSPGDSIGQSAGFLWRPRPQNLQPGTDFTFTLVTPRDASRKLSGNLVTRMDKAGNFISLTLRGEDPQHIASVLNSLMDRYVDLAAELKRRKLVERREILEEQLIYAQTELERAEQELEAFRVATVTLPTDPMTPIAPGLAETRDPVFENFFRMKIEQEQLARDRRRLDAVLTSSLNGWLSVEALEAVPSARESAQLSRAMAQLVDARAELRALEDRYEDAYRPVQDLRERIETLERQTIPQLIGAVLGEVRQREAELDNRVDAASADLSHIPARTIQEARLRRQVQIQEEIYNDLRQRVETTQLASASSIADVSVLDEATAPEVPANDQRIRMMLMVAAAILGAGGVGAVFLDRMDPTIHDPLALENEIGLMVIGAVPKIGSDGKGNDERVLESFRELRMNVEFAHGRAGPLVVTVSSPSTGEGKSLVSANLALVFADIGRRTLLIDGDTRRGDVHELLGIDRRPGLTDYLAGLAWETAVQPTPYPNLEIIASGSRSASSPEMLASSRMRDLFAEARSRYDVVIVDSPPLTAGADAALLSALTGSLVLVVRSGTTQREMVLAKLEGLRRFPIRVLGAILNDFAETGRNRYYYYANYVPGYEARAEAQESAAGELAAVAGGGGPGGSTSAG